MYHKLMDRFSIIKGDDPPPERTDAHRESKPQTPKASTYVSPGVYRDCIGESIAQPAFFQTLRSDTAQNQHQQLQRAAGLLRTLPHARSDLILARRNDPENAIRIYPTDISFSGNMRPDGVMVYTVNLSFQVNPDQLNRLTGSS